MISVTVPRSTGERQPRELCSLLPSRTQGAIATKARKPKERLLHVQELSADLIDEHDSTNHVGLQGIPPATIEQELEEFLVCVGGSHGAGT